MEAITPIIYEAKRVKRADLTDLSIKNVVKSRENTKKG